MSIKDLWQSATVEIESFRKGVNKFTEKEFGELVCEKFEHLLNISLNYPPEMVDISLFFIEFRFFPTKDNLRALDDVKRRAYSNFDDFVDALHHLGIERVAVCFSGVKLWYSVEEFRKHGKKLIKVV